MLAGSVSAVLWLSLMLRRPAPAPNRAMRRRF